MNKFFGPFLTKIIVFTLAGAFHFSAYAWEASEANCKKYKYGLEKEQVLRCSVGEGLCGNDGDPCGPLNSSGDPSGRCRTVEIYDDQELERRDRDCQDWKSDKEKEEELEREREEEEEEAELEFAKEQAEKMEEERNKALEEQQKMLEQAQNECKSSYDEVKDQRNRIESQVKNIQQQLDRIEDEITKHYASISEGEDKVRDEILRLRLEERQVMNDFKRKKAEAERAEQEGDRSLQEAIENIENDLYDSASTLEDIARAKEQVCSDRAMEYLTISVNCYNEKLAQVTAEREELFKRIHSGRYESASVSNLFQMDSQNIDQTFKRRLDALHAHCFAEKTGESLPHPGQSLTVQIRCELEAFERRVKDCRENNNNRTVCPTTPGVQAIEQKALAQLRQIEKDVEKIERARAQAIENIQKLRDRHRENEDWMAKALADLEEELRLTKRDFKERHERAENELLRVRERAENSILQLERDKIRLLASDPARHFEEVLIVARVSCCSSVNPQQTAQQCALLSRYEQDSSRFQFAFARPLPALRSTSGPSSRRTGNTGSSSEGGGVQ